MKTIEIGSLGFINLTRYGFTLHLSGASLYFGWFPDIDLIGFQISLFEWNDAGGDVFGLCVFRFQFLHFLFSLHLG